eukprot:gene34157-44131_t
MTFFPPLNFCAVEEDLYRSGMPYESNFQYLKSLQLKTVLVLSSDCLDTPLLKFLEDNNVTMRVVEQTLITEEMITESLKIIVDKRNLPLLMIDKFGRNLNGVVVACLRKVQQWALISVFEEYRRFSGLSRLQQQHEQFVEIFDTELITIDKQNAPNFLLWGHTAAAKKS